MPGAERPEPIVALTDAPTAEEEHAIGSGLARFYERHGYRVLGTVPCLPPGTSRVFMTKALG